MTSLGIDLAGGNQSLGGIWSPAESFSVVASFNYWRFTNSSAYSDARIGRML